MRAQRGQALAEVALCLPVVLALALGTVAVARVADARGGLDAATAAAAQAAARAPDAGTAAAWARSVLTRSIIAYGLTAPSLTLELGEFRRGASITARATAQVAIGFAPVPGLPATVTLTAQATARVEPWRTR